MMRSSNAFLMEICQKAKMNLSAHNPSIIQHAAFHFHYWRFRILCWLDSKSWCDSAHKQLVRSSAVNILFYRINQLALNICNARNCVENCWETMVHNKQIYRKRFCPVKNCIPLLLNIWWNVVHRNKICDHLWLEIQLRTGKCNLRTS